MKPKADIAKYAGLSEAQSAHEAAGQPGRTGPLFRAVAKETLDDCAKSYAAGNDWALITALNTCAVHELPVPQWLADAWLPRSRAVMHYKAASWDDVLPKVKPKGRKLSSLRLAHRWSLAVVQAVYREADPDRAPAQRSPIDDGLFERLVDSEQWPFKPALAKKLYYNARKKPSGIMRMYFDRLAATSTIRQKS